MNLLKNYGYIPVMQYLQKICLSFSMGISLGLAVLLFWATAVPARDITTHNSLDAKLMDFDYTRPPFEPREDLDAYQWSRVYITELHRPTFDKGQLNVEHEFLQAWWAELYAKTATAGLAAKLKIVNEEFNRIEFVGFAERKETREQWGTPKELLTGEYVHSGGYAIMKYFALLALGVPENQLSLMVVSDTFNNKDHILLVVTNGDAFYLLDNVHNAVARGKALHYYVPQYFVNSQSVWFPYFSSLSRHSYREGKQFKMFIPSSAKKRDLNLPNWSAGWNRVCAAEQRDPTFSGRVLHSDNIELTEKWARLYDTLVNQNIYVKMQYVNAFFNQWKYTYDEVNWRQRDSWATPAEFLERGGDCEDYAIIKYFALRALGVPADSLLIVWVLEARGGHAVLAVLDGDTFYILDNNYHSNTIYRNGGYIPYQPLYYLNEHYGWRHLDNK